MSGKHEFIDARGLVCPEPVVRVKKAMDSSNCEGLDIVVDNPAARENVARFAGHSGYRAEVREEGQGLWRISVSRGPAPTGGAPGGEAIRQAPAPSIARASGTAGEGHPDASIETLLLASDSLGQGDWTLGALLAKGFIYSLAEGSKKPLRLILMNGGVRLATENSPCVKDLRRLAEEGVEIIACGTCLDFFGLKEQLAVGRVGNMYEIADLLMGGRCLKL